MKKTSKRLMAGILAMALTVGAIGVIGTTTEVKANEDEGVLMYRLYNQSSGEHLYTMDNNEKDVLIRRGWNYEGYSWIASSDGENVYRIFNPYSGEHHYTMDKNEKNWLISTGWNDEGVAWHTRTTGSDCETPVYRLFCPFTREALKAHHYTMDKSERDYLISNGWNDEGICWRSMHDVVADKVTEPTCIHEGYSGGAVCRKCNRTYEGTALPRNKNNHTNTSFIPEEIKVIDRGTQLDHCSVYNCNFCGAEIWRQGDDAITGLNQWDSIIEHNNNIHGFSYHTYQDVLDGIITDEDYCKEENEQRRYWKSRVISGYFDTVVIPAHFRCNDCGRAIF